jgi:hypothetical protein
MSDGKDCNAISENKSAQRCYICESTPKVMNDLTSFLLKGREGCGIFWMG